jgi:hypothetical protein
MLLSLHNPGTALLSSMGLTHGLAYPKANFRLRPSSIAGARHLRSSPHPSERLNGLSRSTTLAFRISSQDWAEKHPALTVEAHHLELLVDPIVGRRSVARHSR